MRQTWMTRLTLAISLWVVIFFWSEKILLLICRSCKLCERRTYFCIGFISRKLCRFLCFQLALLHSVSYFFFLYRSPSLLLCSFFSFSSDINKILLINPSANLFVFGDFNIHHKDRLTYSGRTDRPGELCYNFAISRILFRCSVSYLDPWLWLSLSCSFGLIYFFCH